MGSRLTAVVLLLAADPTMLHLNWARSIRTDTVG